MENKFEIVSLFPIPICIGSIPQKYSKLKTFLESQEMSTKGDRNSEFGRRSINSYVLNEPSLSELSDYILKQTTEYGSQALGYSYKEYKFSQSWISHKHPGEEHLLHTHPNSLISGIFYYDQIEKNIPHVILHKPPFNDTTRPQYAPNLNEYSYQTFSITPSPGLLVLFPSELEHSVPKNETNLVRKSLAFNIVPVEGFGEEDSLNQLKFN